MKQMFAEEIASEQQLLANAAHVQRKTPPPPPPPQPGGSSGSLSVGDAVGRVKTPSESRKAGVAPALIVVDDGSNGEIQTVSFALSAAEVEKLRVAADRSGVAIEDVLQDLLRNTLKYF